VKSVSDGSMLSDDVFAVKSVYDGSMLPDDVFAVEGALSFGMNRPRASLARLLSVECASVSF
jgi:hypothetical protein